MTNQPPTKPRTTKARPTTTPAAIARRDRDEQCAKLRRAGLGWDQIASQLGYSSAGHAYDRFMLIMKEYPREDIEAARDLEADRLDQLQRALWPKCLAGDEAAITTALRIMDQRARLLGYNAPVRKEITVLTESVVDKALAQAQADHEAMVAQLRELEARAALSAGPDVIDAEVVDDVPAEA